MVHLFPTVKNVNVRKHHLPATTHLPAHRDVGSTGCACSRNGEMWPLCSELFFVFPCNYENWLLVYRDEVNNQNEFQ